MISLRQAAERKIRSWSARRHGCDALPATIHRRRIYILPTRYGLMLGGLIGAMLIAALNYNSNLGLAFAFLMASLALVAMHHCHRNLAGVGLDAQGEVDAFAGAVADFEFLLSNASPLDRYDIEIRLKPNGVSTVSVPKNTQQAIGVAVPTLRRGILRFDECELSTRYPLGWFRAWSYVQAPFVAFAAPSPHGEHALPPTDDPLAAGAYAEARGDEDFAGLRAYQPGIPLKHMAWKVLARGGEAAVRSYTGSAAEPEWLEWSALDDMDTEARLSQLCRWVLDRDGARRAFGLRIPGCAIGPDLGASHRRACLRALATFTPGPPP